MKHSLVWNEEKNPFKQMDITFHIIVYIAEEVGERPGCFQDLECQEMKRALVAMENEGTGRVPLSKNSMDTHLMEVSNFLKAASTSIT